MITQKEKVIAKEATQKAAKLLAMAARVASGKFSRRIPLSVKVIPFPSGNGAYIVAGGDIAPNAYPFETGARHPLFAEVGSTRYTSSPWYPQPKRPFLDEAADSAISAMANVMAAAVDDICDAAGL